MINEVRVLVTGSEGFIGKSLRSAIAKNYPNFNLFTIDINGIGQKHFNIDLNSKELPKVISNINPHVVVHLAGNVSVEKSIYDPQADFENNLRGTLMLLLALCETKIRSFVYINSGGAIYDQNAPRPFREDSPVLPISPYGISKLSAEAYVRVFCERQNVGWTSLAISNCYGKVQEQFSGVMHQFWKCIQLGKSPVIHGMEMTRDFIHVSDVISAIILAMETPVNTRLNISSNTSTRLIDLFDMMKEILNVDVIPIVLPGQHGHLTSSQLDNTKAQLLLSWRPIVTLQEGLRSSLQ